MSDKLMGIDDSETDAVAKNRMVADFRQSMADSFKKRMLALSNEPPPINCRCVISGKTIEVEFTLYLPIYRLKKKSLVNHLRTWEPPTELKKDALPIGALASRSVGVRYNPLINGF